MEEELLTTITVLPLSKDARQSNQVNSCISVVSIAGYVVGCFGLIAVVSMVCWTISSGYKRRKSSISRNNESNRYQAERERSVRRNIHSEFPEFVNPYEDLPDARLEGISLSQRTSSPPNPPPLPDISDLPDHCPENELHYENRTAIMAITPGRPRKPRLSIAQIESLSNLLAYCEEKYGTNSNKSDTEDGPPVPKEYVNMRDAVDRDQAGLDIDSEIPTELSGPTSDCEKITDLPIEGIIESLATLLEYCKSNIGVGRKKREEKEERENQEPLEQELESNKDDNVSKNKTTGQKPASHVGYVDMRGLVADN